MRVVKLSKNQDIAQAIQSIRDSKDDEVVFELSQGSPLLTNSTNLKLLKKTAEVLKKKVKIRTDDPTGQLLAIKAGILDESVFPAKSHQIKSKVKRSDIKLRFSDIVRPNKFSQTSQEVTRLEDYTKVKVPDIKPQTSARQNFSSRRISKNFSKYFVVGMVVLVLIVFGLAVLLPAATITVYARSEPINRDTEITIDKNALKSDSSKLLVPAVSVSKEVTQTKNFPTTGTKVVGTKATGSITIYNFTKNTLTLRAATTTLLAGKMKFVFTKDVTGIRPTARIGSGADEEIDPSSLNPPVAIEALEVGADSNLPAGTQFTIQNAALGNTTNVLAANDIALTGGTSKNIQILSQADLDKAVISLTDGITEQAQADLNSENAGSDLRILPTAVTKEVLAKTANRGVGEEVAEFDMTMIAKISGLAYHEDHLKEIILGQIQSVLSDDKYILPDAAHTLTANFKTVDLAKGVGVLSVHFETTAAYKVNQGDISKALAGKSATQIKEILLAKPEIDRVDVEFSPFFVNKAPKLNGKIYINTMLSEGS